MIRLRSMVIGVDNSGLIKARAFHFIGKQVGTIGSLIRASAKRVDSTSEWKRGDKLRGLLVLVKKEKQRNTGIVFKGHLNGIVLINKKWEPIGTRVNATLPKELRFLGYMKVIAISTIVV